jgi:hypothetical protein
MCAEGSLATVLATAMRRLSPRSSALQQPRNIFVHDKRDACPGEHPDDVCAQATVEPHGAFVRPCMRDCGRDGAVVRA